MSDKKDIWEKLQALSVLISGVLVGLIGIYATNSYNNRQLESRAEEKQLELAVMRVQVVEKFFERLNSDNPKTQSLALAVIGALGDEQLATDLAEQLNSEGATIALSRLANSANPKIAARAGLGLKEKLSEAAAQRTVYRIDAECGQASSRFGSGFRADGFPGILTALHIVLGCRNIRAIGSTANEIIPLNLEWVDIARNIAVLYSSDLQIRSLPKLPVIHDVAAPQELMIGYAQYNYSILMNYVRASKIQRLGAILTDNELKKIRDIGFPNENIEIITIEGIHFPDLSGAPLIDLEGNVIGIVNTGLSRSWWAVPFSDVVLERSLDVAAQLEKLARATEYPERF